MLDGLGVEYKPISEEERIKLKCDAYNELQGDLSYYDCNVCKNKGFISIPKETDGSWSDVMQECKCIKARTAIKRISESGLEKVIKDKTFEKYEVTADFHQKFKEAAYSFYKEPCGWFYMGGQSGCGKTHLCTAICSGLIKKGKSVVYMQWINDSTKLKGCITDGNTYESLIRTFKEAEVLYIDDLFKTGNDINNKPLMPTASDVKIAFEIINFRAINRLTTIISSERVAKDLIQIDEATAGRIIEMSSKNMINIPKDLNKNYRLKSVL